jgi:hypothetical protein
VTEFADEIAIVRDEAGRLWIAEGKEPPLFASFGPELIACLRRHGSLWAHIEGDLIRMQIEPEPLFYRLTGEVDDFGVHVAQRMTADGRVWA